MALCVIYYWAQQTSFVTDLQVCRCQICMLDDVRCRKNGLKGYLDEQFCQVEDLQDEASPNFAEEVVSLFFKDSARLVTNIEQAMEKYPKDFNRWDAHMQQLRGSCFRRTFQKVKREHAILRQKLESYFQRKKTQEQETCLVLPWVLASLLMPERL
uniref:Histidine-containing phosphotransfer protein n=1 Tax=Aegilops tauschii TaxID=37682 RepID=R7W942_AEGTA